MTEDLIRQLRGNGPVCPAVQLRVLLLFGREHEWAFAVAWKWAFERVRMPHDTTARKEWRAILGECHDDARPGPSRQREMWCRAYERSEASGRERAGGRLLVAA